MNKRFFSKVFLAKFCGLVLSGCSLLSPVEVKPPHKYMLSEIPVYVPQQTHSTTLFVSEPDTRPIYNTTQMAYMTHPYQISFYRDNEWSETPSQLLRPLIVKTLQKSCFFHAVVTPPYMGSYDYSLSTNILEFVQDFTACPAMLRLTLKAQLMKGTTNQVIATQEFSINEPILQRSAYAGVIAANHATPVMLRKLVNFTLQNAQRR